MRIGVVAGEVSGDILGARVLAALRQHYSDIVFEGVGGPLMQAQGLHSLYPMERLSVMGLVEPLQRLPELVRMRRALYRHFRANPPDLLLGIDAPDFNLALERKLRRLDIPTAHLVSPSVWAWRRGRIHKIKRSVDLMRADGYALVMSTILRGRPALRLCPIHPGTTADEIRETIRRLAAFSVEASAQ